MPRDIERPLEESEPVDTAGPLRPAAPPSPTLPARTPPRWPLAAAAARLRSTGLRGVWPALRRALSSLGHRCRRTARAARSWSRSPAGRLALPALLTGGLIAAAATAGGLLIPQASGDTAPVTPAANPTHHPGAPPTGAPPLLPSGHPGNGPTGSPAPAGLPSDVLRGWAQQMSARTDVPAVALQAYGYAELVLGQTQPGCQLRWTTLAAIGWVESQHGQLGAATLHPDGRALPEIIGLPLDGQGDRRLIEDTDNGAIDGDPIYDRAVGPMQFIPETWQNEQIDATGDGVADPHNIHDAALAAANYLCANGRDLTQADDWWAAVLSYNQVQAYAEDVFAAATDYGQRSQG